VRGTRILVLVAAVTLASCVGSSAVSTSPSPGPSAEESASVASSPQQRPKPKPVDPRKGGFEIGFGEFAITLEARAIRPGPVTFVIHNGGKLVHGFEMKAEDDGGSNSGPGGGGDDRFEIEAPTFGPDGTIRIKANLPVGLYEIECYVADHDDLGMRNLLRVRRDAPFIRPKRAAQGEILIKGFAFDPQTVDVKAGSKISWRNADPTDHTVTAKDGSFDSKPLPSGKGFVVTFSKTGLFDYFCAIHPTMTGTIQVTG
jgi:uncharacterized cupredoxin-like copper-binding protein